MKILITGSQGFVGSYLCEEFLKRDYEVVGVDNFSKYGPMTRSHDTNQNFTLYELDIAQKPKKFYKICKKEAPDIIIANAAIIGGISLFHKLAYDLMATNERILASTFDAAIKLYQKGILHKIVVMSSSMVFENTNKYPTKESDLTKCPPPSSTYGFQKLASEYFAKGAFEQYGLPYLIIRPFNCVGVGEDDAISDHEEKSGNIKLMMSHVLPDLINKCLKGQSPLRILGEGNQIRCYTNGKDLARGVRMAIESEIVNDDFNISIPEPTTVLELAEKIWNKINPDVPFEYECDTPYTYDVQKRIPCTEKATKLLNFTASIDIDQSIDEVIAYCKEKL